MKCEACGGDGQIEYGAYRGDESGPTRECRLCGGVMTTTPTVVDIADSLSASAQSASGGLTQLAHKVSESGKRLTDLVITTAVYPSGTGQTQAREVKPHKSAKEQAAERLEQLRQENERKQAKALAHVHTWKFTKVSNGPYGDGLSNRRIYFDCECGQAQLQFNTGGQLVTGKVKPAPVVLDKLSKQARVEGLRDKARRRKEDENVTTNDVMNDLIRRSVL